MKYHENTSGLNESLSFSWLPSLTMPAPLNRNLNFHLENFPNGVYQSQLVGIYNHEN